MRCQDRGGSSHSSPRAPAFLRPVLMFHWRLVPLNPEIPAERSRPMFTNFVFSTSAYTSTFAP
jgi:hypothetical protein